MTPGRRSRIDPDAAHRITLADLFFACVVAFVIAPALAFALGFTLLAWAFAPAALDPFAAALTAFGYTGLLAWAATPMALIAGWWATRSGHLGWGIAIVAGMAGGALFSLPFIGGTDIRLIGREVLSVVATFAGLGAIYGGISFAALRWLRADLFRPPT